MIGALVNTGIDLTTGVVGGLVSRYQREKAMKDMRENMAKRPDLLESDAYSSALATASMADRRAEQGFSGDEMAALETSRDRVVGSALNNANSLESGLLGMGSVVQSTTDSVRNDMVASEQLKRQNRAEQYKQRQNVQDIQMEDFNLAMGDIQFEQDLISGELAGKQEDINTITKGFQNAGENFAATGL